MIIQDDDILFKLETTNQSCYQPRTKKVQPWVLQDV